MSTVILVAVILVGINAALTIATLAFQATAETMPVSAPFYMAINAFSVGTELICWLWIFTDGQWGRLNLAIAFIGAAIPTIILVIQWIPALQTRVDRRIASFAERVAQGDALADKADL